MMVVRLNAPSAAHLVGLPTPTPQPPVSKLYRTHKPPGVQRPGEETVPLPRLITIPTVSTVRAACPLPGHRIPAQLPRLDNPPLGFVDIALIPDGAHADAHPLFGEVDVAARHALLGGAADLDDALVDVVADDGEAAKDDGEEDEGDELPGEVVLAGGVPASRRAGLGR